MQNPHVEIRKALAGLTDTQARGVLELALQRIALCELDSELVIKTIRKERQRCQLALQRLLAPIAARGNA